MRSLRSHAVVPTTLLLRNESKTFRRLVGEEEKGHSRLLRAALSGPSQEAFVWATVSPSSTSLLGKMGLGGKVVNIFTDSKMEEELERF